MNTLTAGNYYFNPYAIPPFLTCMCIVMAMCFFYQREGNTFISFSLLLMSVTFFMWIFADGMMFSSLNIATASKWISLCFFGVILLPVSCLQVFFVIIGIYKKHRILIRYLWLTALVFYLAALSTTSFISGIHSYWWGYYPTFGWIGALFICFSLSIFSYSIYQLLIEHKKAAPDSLQQARTHSCIIAFFVGCLGCLDYIATLGTAFYPPGYAAIFILLLLLARNALRYQLNITPSFAAANIINTMSDALIILAANGTISLTNQVAERLFGQSKDQLCGTEFRQLTNWDIISEDKRQLARHCPIVNHAVLLPQVNLPPVHLEMSISAMRESNRTTAFVCLLHDVSQKIIAKQKIEQSRQKLERQVAQRTLELEQTNQELLTKADERNTIEQEKAELTIKSLTQSKLASLGEVATGIAHEINQPLSFIRIIFEATIKDLTNHKLNEAELADDYRESIKQVNRISAIIDHLRTFGRQDNTEMQDNVDLRAILDNTMILMQQKLRLRNINLSIGIDDNISPIKANPFRLEQIFINLLQNSVDALEGIASPHISIDIYQHKKLIQIIFTDNGSGVPPQIREKIFEPFFTSKEVGKGTGLGLSIIYGIIREHQGTIELDCSNDQTSFIIALPVM